MKRNPNNDLLRAQIGPFVMIPVWLLDSCSDSRAIHLYAEIGRYADREGLAWPKGERLAKGMDTSLKSIERGLKELRRVGALKTSRRYDANGSVAGLNYLLIQINPHLTDTGVGQATSLTDTGDATKPTPVSVIYKEELDPLNQIQKDLPAAPADRRSMVQVYHDAFVQRFDKTPAINGRKDGALLKRLAESHGQVRVRELIEWFFRIQDPFIAGTGYTVGVFSSCFNKLLLTYKPPRTDDHTAELLLDIRQRAATRRMQLEVDAAAAISALDPSMLAVLRCYMLEQHGQVDGALLSELSPEARERSIKGAMVSCVADLCAGDRSVADTLTLFVQEHVA